MKHNKQIKSNPEADRLRERLRRHILDHYRKGDLVTYERMCEVIELDRYAVLFRTVWNRLRKELLAEHEMVFRAEWNVGYRILTDRETSRRCPQERSTRSRRQIQCGINEMESVDVNMLPLPQRHAHVQRRFMLERTRLELSRVKKAITDAEHKTPTNPKRPRD